jgi:isocitrate dehydrogenase (NAD+)
MGDLLTSSLGIGPEISESVKAIYSTADVSFFMTSVFKQLNVNQVPIEWEEVSVTPVLKGGKTIIPDAAINSVKKNTVALKGECP